MIESLFYAGFDNLLLKSDKDDPTIIYLEASNEDADSQGEVVLAKALSDEAESFLKKGVLSWDHQHKLQKDPNFIIGEPLDVKISKSNTTLIKGRLYKENEYAQGVMKMAKSGSTRLGASIGGGIKSRTEYFNKSLNKSVPVIEQLVWDEVAITHKPVNVGTRGKVTNVKYAEFGKSFAFASDVEVVEFNKALMAGGGVDASTMTGGRALIPETVRKQVVNKEFWKDIITGVASAKVVDYKSLCGFLGKYGITDKKGQQFIASIVTAKSKDFLSEI